jgi:hypothetical protein
MSDDRRSSGGPYRQGDRDARRQTEQLQAEVEELRPRIAPRYWELLDELAKLRDEIDQLPAPQRREQWRQHAQLLEEFRNQLTYAIDRAPALEASLSALPHSIEADALGKPWPNDSCTVWLAREWASSRTSARHEVAAQLASYIGRHDPGAQVLQRFDYLRVPSAHIQEVPVALALHRVGEGLWGFEVLTPVARALPAVLVRPKTLLHEISESLGIQQDAKTGDPRFDDVFMVTERRDGGIVVLDERVRKHLMAFAAYAPPTLDVADGLASLRYHHLFSTDVIGHAVELLGHVRHRRVELALVH